MFHCDLKKKFFWDPLEHTGIYYKLNQNNLKREQFYFAVVGKDLIICLILKSCPSFKSSIKYYLAKLNDLVRLFEEMVCVL